MNNCRYCGHYTYGVYCCSRCEDLDVKKQKVLKQPTVDQQTKPSDKKQHAS